MLYSFYQFSQIEKFDAQVSYWRKLLQSFSDSEARAQIGYNRSLGEYDEKKCGPLPRNYIKELAAPGHCIVKHGHNDIPTAVKRMLNECRSVSSFYDEKEAYRQIERALIMESDKIVKWLIRDDFKSSFDRAELNLYCNMGKICGDGISDTDFTARSTDQLFIKIKRNCSPASNLFISIVTAYPIVDHEKAEINNSDAVRKEIVAQLDASSDSYMQSVWALKLHGYDVHFIGEHYHNTGLIDWDQDTACIPCCHGKNNYIIKFPKYDKPHVRERINGKWVKLSNEAVENTPAELHSTIVEALKVFNNREFIFNNKEPDAYDLCECI